MLLHELAGVELLLPSLVLIRTKKPASGRCRRRIDQVHRVLAEQVMPPLMWKLSDEIVAQLLLNHKSQLLYESPCGGGRSPLARADSADRERGQLIRQRRRRWTLHRGTRRSRRIAEIARSDCPRSRFGRYNVVLL